MAPGPGSAQSIVRVACSHFVRINHRCARKWCTADVSHKGFRQNLLSLYLECATSTGTLKRAKGQTKAGTVQQAVSRVGVREGVHTNTVASFRVSLAVLCRLLLSSADNPEAVHPPLSDRCTCPNELLSSCPRAKHIPTVVCHSSACASSTMRVCSAAADIGRGVCSSPPCSMQHPLTATRTNRVANVIPAPCVFSCWVFKGTHSFWAEGQPRATPTRAAAPEARGWGGPGLPLRPRTLEC